MRIRCIIRRAAGSSQTLDGITYHWNDANDHVCEVENVAHAQRLLDVPESWREEPGAVTVITPAAEGEAADEVVAETAKPRRGRPRKAAPAAEGEAA